MYKMLGGNLTPHLDYEYIFGCQVPKQESKVSSSRTLFVCCDNITLFQIFLEMKASVIRRGKNTLSQFTQETDHLSLPFVSIALISVEDMNPRPLSYTSLQVRLSFTWELLECAELGVDSVCVKGEIWIDRGKEEQWRGCRLRRIALRVQH